MPYLCYISVMSCLYNYITIMACLYYLYLLYYYITTIIILLVYYYVVFTLSLYLLLPFGILTLDLLL